MKQETQHPQAVARVFHPSMAAPRRLSQVLRELADGAKDGITVAQLRDALGDRGFAALFFIFSAINLLPLPPGTSVILGIPMIIVAFQMVAGYKNAWLPRFLLAKTIGPKQMARMRTGLIPRLERVERVIQPRYWPFPRNSADRIIGVIGLILAIAVTLPVPLGNWLPALAATLVALGLMERDGIVLGVGVAVGAVSLAIIAAVVGMAGALASVIFG